jgi:hypothetical protein
LAGGGLYAIKRRRRKKQQLDNSATGNHGGTELNTRFAKLSSAERQIYIARAATLVKLARAIVVKRASSAVGAPLAPAQTAPLPTPPPLPRMTPEMAAGLLAKLDALRAQSLPRMPPKMVDGLMAAIDKTRAQGAQRAR